MYWGKDLKTKYKDSMLWNSLSEVPKDTISIRPTTFINKVKELLINK